MREMKDSGIEWIGEMPKGWTINRIKNLFSNCKGLSITKENLIDNGLPVISYGQIHSKENDGTSIKKCLLRYVDYSYQKNNPKCEVRKNDFVFADTSEDYEGCGNCVYKRDDTLLFGGYHSIILHSICNVNDNRYLAYLFKTDSWRKQIRETASGVKVYSVTQKALMNTSVILPTFPEQKSIADFLDSKCSEIDGLISDIQKQITTLEEYKRSVITESVTKGLNPDAEMKDSEVEWIGEIPKMWDYSRLGYESYIRARLGWKGLKADEYVPEGYAFISAFNIQNNKLVWEPLNYITEERYNESPEIKLSVGDVIIVKDGAGVGKCARIDELPLGGTAPNSSIGVITPFEKLEYRYLSYYLQSAIFGNFVMKLLNGMGVPHLTQEMLGNINILIPPKNEQVEIADYLDEKIFEIDECISAKQEQLSVLEDYKKSLIYEYVTGKKEVYVNE